MSVDDSAQQRQVLRAHLMSDLTGRTSAAQMTGDQLPALRIAGFVWRVYKISGLSWGHKIQGRTAAHMAGEIPRRQRLHYDQLRPGDLLFFGSAHFNTTATEANVIHTGNYLGDNWVIHSSGQGVYVLPLKGGWLGDQFAWGRRVLR
jgi:cell wall-associated NlpC family hydrolase